MTSTDLPSGYVLDQPEQSSDVLAGYTLDHSSAAPPPGYQLDGGWQQKAAAEVQRQGLNPLTDSSQMIAVYDAHRKAFGSPQEQAMPEYGQQLVGQQQQLQQQANSEHGQLASALLEALHPAAQVMAGAENTLAPVVGAVAPGAAENMRQHAQTLENVRGDTDSVGGTIGAIAGNIPVMANPLIAGGIAGGETYHQIENQKAAGANIGGADEALDVAGQGVLNAAMSYLMQDTASSQGVTGSVAETLESKLASMAPSYIAKYGSRAAVRALINAGQGLASNFVTQATVDPNQSLTEGTGKNMLLGAGVETGLGLLHDVTGKTPGTDAAEPTPAAAVPEEGTNVPAAVTQTETPAQRQRFPAFFPELADTGAQDAIDKHQELGARIGALDDQLTQSDNFWKQKREALATSGLPSDESVSEKPAENKFTSRDMVNYINVHSDDADLEGARQLLGDKNYVQRDVPIDQLSTRGSTELKQSQIDQYAAKPSNTAPPVVADEGGQIIDGNRRLEAARLRGDTTVKAYVPDTFGQDVETAKPEIGSRPSLVSRLASDESGGTQVLRTFAERTVIPEAKSTLKAARETYESANRFLGTGASDDAGAEGVKNDVRKMNGNMDLDRAKVEEALRPSRTAAEKYSPKEMVSWMEALEAGQPSPDPASQKAMDLHQAAQPDRIKAATKYGINTSKWSEDWAGRLAEFPDKGTGAGGTIAGSQGFLKSQQHETFGEFKKAVEAAGGKLKYSNPVDMMLAKDLEVDKSIAARKLLYQNEDKGNVQWVGEGTKWPDGHTALEDRLGQQKRPLIAPKDIVARAAGMKHFEANDFLDKQEAYGTVKPLRPGDDMPKDYTFTGREKAGKYAASGGVTPTFNDLIAPGAGSKFPILDKIVQAKRAMNNVRMSFSAWHLSTETMRHMGAMVGLAADNAVHGEFGEALTNLKRANPVLGAKFGGDVLKAARETGQGNALDPLVKSIADAGEKLRGRSFLDTTAWDKAKVAMKEGDQISGIGRGLQAVMDVTTKPIMEKFVPALKASYEAAVADTYLKRGYTGDKLNEVMRKTVDNANNELGSVVRSNQFQHRVVQNVGDFLMLAPKFAGGDVRKAFAAGRDLVDNIHSVIKGEPTKPSPAAYSLLGHVIVQATAGAAIQMAYTKATTGTMQYPTSIRDFFQPKTGRKDQNGNDERITFPTGLSLFTSVASEGASKTLQNRIDPIWRAIYNVATNSDYRNVKIHDDGVSPTSAGQSAKYIGKSLIPFSAQGLVEKPTGNPTTLDEKVLGVAGVRRASTKLSESDAEQKMDEVLSEHEGGVRTPEDADRRDLRTKYVHMIRNGDPDAYNQIADDRQAGKLTLSDARRIRELAKAPPGIVGRIKESSLDPKSLMRVWDEMTPDEKYDSATVVRRKIVHSSDVTSDDRQTFLDRIQNEVR